MSGPIVCVVGLGYIGLPTATVLASRGAQVIGLDVNERAVATINAGGVHIVEPGLDALVAGVVAQGRLRATTVAEPADAFLIAVPTPFKGDHAPDLAYVEAAARAIAPVLAKGNCVILESTSPVGATEKMAGWIAEARPDLAPGDLAIAYCPERVLPGNVIHELVANDRVIGGLTPNCAACATAIYRIFVEGECIETDARTAELTKLTENSFRDVNIAFANELSLICDKLKIDVWELIALANRHPRVNILQPGPGVGGHCIAVDPWFIVDSAPEQAKLIRQARMVNDAKPQWVIDQVAAAIAATGKPRATVACLGLAFKANIDDLRESPALEIAAALARRDDAHVLAVEPNIDALPAVLAETAELAEAADAVARADVIVVLVDHAPFRDIDRAALAGKAVIDTRGLLPRA